MKKYRDLELSELGVGTYLGDPDEGTSRGYREVIKLSIDMGLNVVDTAIVYRYMKSERDIGEVIKDVGREKITLSTKGGYIPYDIESGMEPKDYFYETFLITNLLKPEELSLGHSLSVKFINWCLETSLKNMKTNYVDVYFLHNPEEALNFLDRKTFYKKIGECFSYLEEEVRAKRIRYYGLATWVGFRVPQNHRQYLNLLDLVNIAKEIGGEDHHLRFIQLPYNLGMTEAFTLKNQDLKGEKHSTLSMCEKLGIYVYTSASTYQGRIIGRVPKGLKEKLKVDSDVLASLQFVLSTPGVGTALVGMSKREHLIENIKILSIPKLSKWEFLSLFE